MCGIFGIISSSAFPKTDLLALATFAQQRGRDSSGLMIFQNGSYHIRRADYPIVKLLPEAKIDSPSLVIGHSRLITNGLNDNQPVLREGICVLHNGIIVNHGEIWDKIGKTPTLQIDTEVIPAIAAATLESGGSVMDIPARVLELCRGVVACAMVIPHLGKLILFSNNGSLYVASKNGATYFSSESYPLQMIDAGEIRQIKDDIVVLDVAVSDAEIAVADKVERRIDLIPAFTHSAAEESMLVYPKHDLRRCTKCILPETMPFIAFDEDGVCNYCKNYKSRNKAKPREEIFALVEPFRRKSGNDCIVPFSGGRDSCYGLHLIVKELGMSPVTYTYDWGMVTDLGRRNISRMSAELGVENIIVAADITKKRDNIKKNLKAWLKSPHLGMISILTAGDKHFFRYVETIKKQTGISLNLWGINPLEVTHFKAGFLGVPPDFAEERVYQSGAMKQIRYQTLRLGAMLQSPGYFNSSLWDTLSGEYYRSFSKKSDYFHVFDYWTWEEHTVDECLKQYDWELAPDTNTTWRIGDGTAAFYNYIYYTVAGFTEHDTFRSNQIREGQLTREEAILLVEDENRPRYTNIRWYLDAVGLDFSETIRVVNDIPRLH
ncbi:glucosamine 6-phosphate synthetase [Devosia sp. PTR5]|uniref:Glutamine--fructose-6-phosphate aminotransferase [isomerizing] n=1 Tax=Devosia oryzisoli TaxID=2774138 RepID=A0A927FVP6_9HYPH|nr:glucosamine 6-phosphate synthetase [Devosia oryzisoli]MBD8066014.1 glucosamine 6-phosphate synthetase [Devosia oryzisoli]